MAQWHKKHYSTSWGIAILGFMVVVIALLIPYLNQTQSLSSHAKIAPTDRPKPTPTPSPIPTPTQCKKNGGICGKSCLEIGRKINNSFSCTKGLNCCVKK